jgi:RNA 3'-terminal phosphate cyclase (ATP)
MALRIDGRYGEGGGQILRTALSLASLLQRPVEITHIREGRKTPGLRPQHLMAVKALSTITAARVEGGAVGSRHLYFEPRDLKSGQYLFNIGTAGSTGLVFQTVLPVLLRGRGTSKITIIGGTHAAFSPCFHYLKETFLPALHGMGIRVFLEIDRWGWYPTGGGKITASFTAVQKLTPLKVVERGKLCKLYLLSAVSNLPRKIGERQKDQALNRLAKNGCIPETELIQRKIGERQKDQALNRLAKNGCIPETELIQAPSPGQGTVVFIGCRFEKGLAGFTSLGKRGKPAEQVANDACDEFFEFIHTNAAIDKYLADQLLLYMALASGRSTLMTSQMTSHLHTNAWLIEQFLPVKFDIDESIGKVSIVKEWRINIL